MQIFREPSNQTDLILVDISNNEHHVHSVFFANRCGDVFCDLECGAHDKLRITLDYASAVVASFIEYVYNLEFSPLPDLCWLELLELCAKFNGPVKKCLEYIETKLEKFTVEDLKNACDKIKAPELQSLYFQKLRQELKMWTKVKHTLELGDFCEVTVEEDHKIKIYGAQILRTTSDKLEVYSLDRFGPQKLAWVYVHQVQPMGTLLCLQVGINGHGEIDPELHTWECTKPRTWKHQCTCCLLIC
jgi:hypothetical protein